MFWFIILGLLALLAWLSSSNKQPTPPPYLINQQWMDYLAHCYDEAKKPAEKAQLQRILTDLIEQGMPQPSSLKLPLAGSDVPTKTVAAAAQDSTQTVGIDSQQDKKQSILGQKQSHPMDNALLLLYFGAFLFLAAAGLFVALAGENGALRVAIIAVVAAVLYGGGMWLYGNMPKLKQAAFTFVGMGMMLAPLAGLATYEYVLKDNAPVVWFATSAICLVLYAHALRVLKNPLTEYIFIGTFVSLFESSVAILNLPTYYYGWMLAATGLLLQIYMVWSKRPLSNDEPTPLSANVLLPASVFTTFWLASEFGIAQTGVSLLLAAVFYGLQAYRAVGDDKPANAIVSHLALIMGAGVIAYSYQQHYPHAALALMALAVAQLGVGYVFAKLPIAILRNMATVTLIALVASVFLAWASAWLSVGALVLLVLVASYVWHLQDRPDSYVTAAVALLGLPYLVGFHALDPILTIPQIAAAVYLVCLIQIIAFLFVRSSKYDNADWRIGFRAALTVSFVALLATLTGQQEWLLITASLVVAATQYCLHRLDSKNDHWLTLSGLAVSVPILFLWPNSAAFLVAILAALAWSLFIALVHRAEISRWVGSVAWLLIPLAVAHQWDFLATANWYAWSYLFATAGLILARYITLKRLGKLPITLLELEQKLHTDSPAYVAGYAVGGIAAFVTSLDGPWYLPGLISLCLAALAFVVSRFVERRNELIIAVPVLVMIAVWSSANNNISQGWYILASSLSAAVLYILAVAWKTRPDYAYNLAVGSLITLGLTPLIGLVSEETWQAPLSLAIAGLIATHFVWSRSQKEREIALGVVALSPMWALSYAGVENTQVYTHIATVVFGIFAYWRSKRGEDEQKHNYLLAMLVMSTVPLALQLLGGSIGGVYGWLFLAEQIVIMLLGMYINDKFVTRWGLYCAVAAVLYQLRALTWLALTLLAVFLIGLAVYQIQKADSKSSDK